MVSKIEDKLNEILFFDIKKIDRLSFITIAITIFLFSFSYVKLYSERIIEYVDYGVDGITFLCIFLNLYVLICRIKKKDFIVKKVDILFIILNIFYLISAILSDMKGYAFFGSDGRYEGFTSLLMYELLYFVARNIKDKKYISKIIDVILMGGLLNVFYSIIQCVFNFESIETAISFGHLAFGLMDNPNMLGLFMCLEFGIAFVLFLTKNKRKYLVCTIAFYIAILLAESSGPFFSVGLTCLITLIYFIVKKLNLKRLITLYAIFIILFPIIQYGNMYINNTFNNHSISAPYIANDVFFLIEKADVLNLIEKRDIVDIYGDEIKYQDIDISTGRLGVWKELFIYASPHILFGVGPDCIFYFVGSNLCNKAHSHYLEVYGASGVFACICYIAFIVSIFIIARRNKNDVSNALLFGFLTYSIAIAMNMSIPFCAIYYYVVIGLLMTLYDNKINI